MSATVLNFGDFKGGNFITPGKDETQIFFKNPNGSVYPIKNGVLQKTPHPTSFDLDFKIVPIAS